MAGAAPLDDRSSLGEPIGLGELHAFRTGETVWPAQMLQISRTGCVIRENPLKLWKRRRKASGIHPRPLSPTHRIGNQPDRQESNHSPNSLSRNEKLKDTFAC